jgi:hypothetical protein
MPAFHADWTATEGDEVAIDSRMPFVSHGSPGLPTRLVHDVSEPALRQREMNFAAKDFNDAGNDVSTNQNIYDRLVEMNAQQAKRPGLAVSWRPLDPFRWEIKLTSGVTFQDGSPFGPEDVAFSLDRPNHVVGAAAPRIRSVASRRRCRYRRCHHNHRPHQRAKADADGRDRQRFHHLQKGNERGDH